MTFQEGLIFVLRVICAEFLVFGTLYVSYTVARYMTGKTTVVLRWCAAIVTGMWLASLAFNLLLSFGQFNLAAATIALGVLAAAIIIFTPSNYFLTSILKDFAWLKKIYRLNKKSPYRWFFYIFSVFAVLTLLRTTVLPLLGWDTLTYHGVKAGMWVQSGKHISMSAPGGWGFYKNYLGGGEVFTTWAMLPFHSGLLAGTVDAVQWILLGFSLYALGRELGIRSRYCWAAAAYILFVPALWLSIGSGYTEPGLNLALVLGTVFAVRFLRERNGRFLLLSLLGFGVAGATKITALPILALVYIILLSAALSPGSDRAASGGWIILGTIAVVLTAGPWFLMNIQQTGYPLSPMPLSIAGVKLGQTTEALTWYRQLYGLEGYDLYSEFGALKKIFRLPLIINPHLSIFSVLPLLISLPVLFRLVRRNTGVAVLTGGIAAAVLISFYHPGFLSVRVAGAAVIGRFLLPVLCLSVIISFLWLKPGSRASGIYYLFILSGTLVHIAGINFYGWSASETIAVLAEILIIIILVIISKKMVLRYSAKTVLLSAALVIPLLLLPPLNIYRNHTHHKAASKSIVLHRIQKYWRKAAVLVDSPDVSRRIAITSGPSQRSDNWFMYFFLGKRLQNELFYIPVTTDGRIIDFGPDSEREKSGDFDSWLSRLYKNKITHVMSFKPASMELSWMKERPRLFKHLAGNKKTWGLYRLNPR